MASGDSAGTAVSIGAQLGIGVSHICSEMSPAGKASFVKQLQNNNSTV